MSPGDSQDEKGGMQERLRAAVERTLATTAGTAAGTADRAQELLDEVARRGLEAREGVARRGQEAGEGVTRRGLEAREEVSRRAQRTRAGLARIRFAGAEETQALAKRLDELERRMERIEIALRTARAGKSKPKVED